MLHRLFDTGTLVGGVWLYVPTAILNKLVGFGRFLTLVWLFAEAADEYGLQGAALGLVNVLMAIATLGLPETLTRFAPAARARGELGRLLHRLVPLTMLASLTVCGALFALAPQLDEPLFATVGQPAPAQADLLTLARLTIVATGAHIAFLVLLGVLKGLRMVTAVVALETLHTAVYTAMVLGGVALLGARAEIVLVAYAAALVVATGLIAALLYAWHARQPTEAARSTAIDPPMPLIRYAAGLALAGVVWQAMLMLPDWYVLKTVGREEAGQFNVVRQLAQLLAVLAVAVNTVLIGTVFTAWESRGSRQAVRVWTAFYKLAMLTLTLIAIALSILRPMVAAILPAAFEVGLQIWGIALAAALLHGHVSYLYVRYMTRGRTARLLLLYAVGLGVMLITLMPLTAWRAEVGLPLQGPMIAAMLGLAATVTGMVAGIGRIHRDRLTVRLLPATALLPMLPPVGAAIAIVTVAALMLAPPRWPIALLSIDDRRIIATQLARVLRRR